MAGSPTPRSDDHPTVAAILDAARSRYERFGPRKTTMGEVARQAGCSRTTLYAHFDSKEDLYAFVLERDTREFLAELEAVAASAAGALEKLRSVFEATRRIYSRDAVLRGAFTGDEEMALEDVARPVVEGYERRVREVLRDVLEAGVHEGSLRSLDAEAVAYLMYELGRSLVIRELAGRGELPFERMLHAMEDVLGRGISRSEARPPVPRRGKA